MFLLTERVGESTCWDETTFTRAFATQQHRSEPDWLQKYGRNATAGLASLWRRRTEAALDRCMASFQAKRHRWRSWWVAQMSLRVNLYERKTFWTFNFNPIMHMLFGICTLLILWTLIKCYCVKCSRILSFRSFTFRKVVQRHIYE